MECTSSSNNSTGFLLSKSKGIEINGLQAVVDEFNELYMIGRMGLDIDDICETTINISRKNYGNLIDGKIKLVGNTIKSSKMPIYIEEFLDVGIEHLLRGRGYEFIQLYNETVSRIYNFQIPLVKIASKANIKDTLSSYRKDMKTKTKAGNFKAKKAYMELLIRDGIKPNLGETVYYVNTGKVKSHGDCKVIQHLTPEQKAQVKAKIPVTGEIERTVQLNCMRIPTDQIENNPDLTTDEYNVAKYLEAFNKRITALTVCFNEDIRGKILTNMIKNPKVKGEMMLSTVSAFTRKECELTNGKPFNDGDQDTLKELFTMEDKEIEFWMRVNKEPNNISDLEMNWANIQLDYEKRKYIERVEGINDEKNRIIGIFKRLELGEITEMVTNGLLIDSLQNFTQLTIEEDENGEANLFFKSDKWEVILSSVKVMLKYEAWAKQRLAYYKIESDVKKHTHESWLTSIWEKALKDEEYDKANKIKKELLLVGIDMDKETEVLEK